MKFRIEMTQDQLLVLSDALEAYSRIGMGQLDVVIGDHIRWHMDLDPNQRLLAEAHIAGLKQAAWGHAEHSSWSIGNPQVPARFREAYDIQQVVRQALAPPSTYERAYYPTHPEWPPVVITTVPEE